MNKQNETEIVIQENFSEIHDFAHIENWPFPRVNLLRKIRAEKGTYKVNNLSKGRKYFGHTEKKILDWFQTFLHLSTSEHNGGTPTKSSSDFSIL